MYGSGEIAIHAVFIFHAGSQHGFQISGLGIHILDAVQGGFCCRIVLVEQLDQSGVVITAHTADHLGCFGVIAIKDGVHAQCVGLADGADSGFLGCFEVGSGGIVVALQEFGHGQVVEHNTIVGGRWQRLC